MALIINVTDLPTIPSTGGASLVFDEQAGEAMYAMHELRRQDAAAAELVGDLTDVLLALLERDESDAEWLFWFTVASLAERVSDARQLLAKLDEYSSLGRDPLVALAAANVE